MKQQFCLRGHDTFSVGRNRNRQCNTCAREQDNQYRQANLEARRASNRKSALKWRIENPEEARRRSIEFRQKHPEKVRAIWLRSKYGITPEAYDAMLAQQDGRCAICDNFPTETEPLHIDHDHATNTVRGLLCLNCNVGLGRLENHLAEAKVYLASY